MTAENIQNPGNLLSKVTEDNIVQFKKGIPGFPNDRRFIIVQNPAIQPFAWMQSMDTPELAFAVASPFCFFPEYRPDVPDHELKVLGSPPQEHVLILSIIRVVKLQPVELHTNLKAPLIINLANLMASQVILSNEAMYSEKAVYQSPAEQAAA